MKYAKIISEGKFIKKLLLLLLLLTLIENIENKITPLNILENSYKLVLNDENGNKYIN